MKNLGAYPKKYQNHLFTSNVTTGHKNSLFPKKIIFSLKLVFASIIAIASGLLKTKIITSSVFKSFGRKDELSSVFCQTPNNKVVFFVVSLKIFLFLIIHSMVSFGQYSSIDRLNMSNVGIIMNSDSLDNKKQKFKTEISNELENILNYWINNAIDKQNGGFIGKIDGNDKVYPEADKGLVLNARILWTFSAAYIHEPNPEYKMMADRSYNYLMTHFWDKKNGGAYWSVDYLGNPKEKHKQIYGQGFLLYGLSEYHRAFKNKTALNTAIKLFNLIEKHAHDTKYGGYFEVATENWELIDDEVITQGKADQKKSMNTHLHIIEPYSNLYRVWKNPLLKRRISELLKIFTENIIDQNTKTQILFFTEDWVRRSDIISFGHDIEASWLLLESAETIEDKKWIEKVKGFSIDLSDSAVEGLDTDGGMYYEKEGSHVKAQKDWWPQAEAMVGFYNSYQLTEDSKYFHYSLKSWEFIKQNLISTSGEWYWGVAKDGRKLTQMDKIGMWKCPYHNARACMELIRRIN